MKIPYSWLAELVEGLPSPAETAEQLFGLGFEVEDAETPGEAIQDVVVAKLLDVKPHPNADKLSLCEADDGGATHRIVCGAKNMKTGDKVALARVDVVLPGGFKIEKRTIRGEASSGMLCSTRELGLGDDHAGIMILPESAKTGSRLIDELGLNDTVFDLGITPNRPDALCAIGLARELAAANRTALRPPDSAPMEPDAEPGFAPKVALEAPDLCPRYTALAIDGLKIGPSPDWLKNRLEACGVRSINNVVDATNYVLLETGQPLHAFDLERLGGPTIVVRRAKAGETLVTIDEEERKLNETMLVIANETQPVAVAGAMGGLRSEVHDGTESILLESAYFDRGAVYRTSKALKLSSEASYRFERGVDIEGVVPAAWRCARLLRELAGGRVRGSIAVADTPDGTALDALRGREQTLRFGYCNRLLGKTLPPEEIEAIFNGLNLKVTAKNGESITVRAPSYRGDIQCEADLAEEVARCHGYNDFEPELPKAELRPPEKQAIPRSLPNRLRACLTDAGLDEAITYSFTDEESLKPFVESDRSLTDPLLRLENPISPRETTMRASVLATLLHSARRNVSRGIGGFGLFEIGRRYLPDGDMANEIAAVGGAIVGNLNPNWRTPGAEMDFFGLKGIVENALAVCGATRYQAADPPSWLHPGRGVSIRIGKERAGWYGELHPKVAEQFELTGRVLVFELDLPVLAARLGQALPKFKPFSNYPAVRRDFALLVPDGASAGAIRACIEKESGNLLEDLTIFDYYRGKQVGEGYTSLGFRLTLRSNEETLREETVEDVVRAILRRLEREMGVKIRA